MKRHVKPTIDYVGACEGGEKSCGWSKVVMDLASHIGGNLDIGVMKVRESEQTSHYASCMRENKKTLGVTASLQVAASKIPLCPCRSDRYLIIRACFKL
jgi:hypothetical protein